MQCPRCQKFTKLMTNHDITLDVCYDGCGGIWFDWLELKKMDEKHEADESFLKELSESKNEQTVLTERIDCPKCDSTPMMRRFWSVKRSVEVDECPKCGGFWLDAGELTHIYSMFETEEDRKKAANELFDDMFGAKMANLKKQAEDDLEKSRQFAHALRFICPSYYLKKDDD